MFFLQKGKYLYNPNLKPSYIITDLEWFSKVINKIFSEKCENVVINAVNLPLLDKDKLRALLEQHLETSLVNEFLN
jgi:hypothetical protein